MALSGFQVDNITLDGTDIGNAETDADSWTFDGFRTTTGSEDRSFLNAYIVDNRQYVGRDRCSSTSTTSATARKQPQLGGLHALTSRAR